MSYNEARSYIGFPIRLNWVSTRGHEQADRVHVFNVGMVPQRGPCLITDKGAIRIDAITRAEPIMRRQAA
ncbi:MAG: hypothetical protein U0S12_08185 [Fimbriimonadales bacterium]